MPSGRTLCVHGIPISLATNYMKIQFDGIRWICCFIEFLPKYCAKKTLESLEICHIEHSNDKWNQNPINEFVRKCCELIVLIFSLHYSNILCSFDGFSSISSSSFYARYAVAYSSNHNSTFCCIHCHIYMLCTVQIDIKERKAHHAYIYIIRLCNDTRRIFLVWEFLLFRPYVAYDPNNSSRILPSE